MILLLCHTHPMHTFGTATVWQTHAQYNAQHTYRQWVIYSLLAPQVLYRVEPEAILFFFLSPVRDLADFASCPTSTCLIIVCIKRHPPTVRRISTSHSLFCQSLFLHRYRCNARTLHPWLFQLIPASFWKGLTVNTGTDRELILFLVKIIPCTCLHI